MALWSNREVDLLLSVEGQAALAGSFSDRNITVEVQWADDLGLWAVQQQYQDGSVEVLLIRWNHFDTALMRVTMQTPQPSNVIGFRSPRS